MPLEVSLQVTTGGDLQAIETLRISRITSLHNRDRDDQVHHYVAERFSPEGMPRAKATFRHRYGDGAWVCTLRALLALGEEQLPAGFSMDEEISEPTA